MGQILINGVSYSGGSSGDFNNGDANNIDYDNTTSGLVATNVQGALDELDSLVDNIDKTEIPAINELIRQLTYSGSISHSMTINNNPFGTVVERRIGNTVFVTAAGGGAFNGIAANTSYVITTLAYKPVATVFGLGVINGGISNESYANMSVSTNGSMSIKLPVALNSTRTLTFSFTYLTNTEIPAAS